MRYFAFILLSVGLLVPSVARTQGRYHQHKGFFAAVGLGMAEANFDLESSDDEADVGTLIDLKLGYGFHDRFAVTAGVASALFSYKYQAQLGGLSLLEGTRNLTFTMLDISAWYFQPIYKDWLKLFARAGLGATLISDEWEGEELDSEESSGVVLSGGIETFFGKAFGMNLEIYFRTYGVTLEGMDNDETHASGVLLNLVWR